MHDPSREVWGGGVSGFNLRGLTVVVFFFCAVFVLLFPVCQAQGSALTTNVVKRVTCIVVTRLRL